ncbi:MAG: hypothetical protein E6K76_11890 [Candidatus Eisenbacteria bacterium]|uniref:GAF domain-containing protein n=1 Tax=Eiseniibacteriota bacterium TaxID=2212470 RepID=A0A538T001_UNCEI|nr:MAG: hypothetical protein E6K76_11890 [Candidatus Eisenbacteria bacterium]
MWISEPRHLDRPKLRRRALDAFGLAVALAFLPELVAARAGVVLEPHPGWIAVLVLAARYGSGGLFTGLIAAAGAVGIGSAVAGAGLVTSWSRLDSGPNLIAFGACLAVSGIASWHLRRQADLCERISALSDRAAEAEATIHSLRGVVARLRARVDRTSASLSFLRDVAARLEGADPVAAAEGAADLVLARTGASAAAVRVGMNGFERLLAVRDARGPMALAPLTSGHAELTVPIRNGNDRVGLIALWGIPHSGLDDATTHDLAVIASWCAPALAVTGRRPEPAAGRAGRVG